MKIGFVSILLLFTAAHFSLAQDRQIVSALPGPGKEVDAASMQKIYDEVKTPYKYGVVIKGEPGEFVDCPNVFRYQNKWYMVYIKIKDKVGYQTYLATSDDLLQWKTLGLILPFADSGWDKWQAAGGIALRDTTWGGTNELQTYDGKYWLSYIGGALKGYETDPLSIGIASTLHPDQAQPWTRFSQNPVLSGKQSDAREFEKTTLFKSCVIRDKDESLGYPFVMFYNARAHPGFERIGMAVSKNMTDWQRYGDTPVITNGETPKGGRGISGDPQVVKIGDLWVMFYFGAFWHPGAFDTFACSYDLVHWTKWTGENLIKSSEPYDKGFAHKPFLLSYQGVVYHYYCAVGDQGRVIALATSKPMNGSAPENPSATKN